MKLVGYTNSSLKIQLKFENPLSISMGSQLDILVIKFIEPDLFVSKETNKPLNPDAETRSQIPKQFLNEFYYSILEAAGTTV